MNAFISYSIGQDEQYLLNLLAQKVAENNLTLVTSYNQSNSIDLQATNDIKSSALFIGLITNSGDMSKMARVFSEFKQANLFGKAAILLIEDSVTVAPWIYHYQNTIRFNRYNINEAIQEVKHKIENSDLQSNANTAAWLIGGVAVLALLALLSEKTD